MASPTETHHARSARPETADDPSYTAAVIPTNALDCLMQIAEERGANFSAWFNGLALTRAQLNDATVRVSYREASLLIKRAMRGLVQDSLGLDVGRRQSVGTFGVLGLAMMTARTFGEAMQIGIENHQIAGSMMEVDFDVVDASSGSTYQPENVKNYEAGIKSYFPDYHLLLNASIYYYKFSNLQSVTLVQDVNNGLPLYLVTSSYQDAKGLELEAHGQATDGLRLNFTSAYIDARYKDFVDSNQIDLSGQPTGEPSFSAAAGMDYVWRNVVGGAIDFTLQHAHRGKTRCNSASPLQGNCLITPSFKLGTAQERTDMRIAWNSESNIWAVALFANNLFDKRYVTGINNISTSTIGTPFASISPPRMYGVELSAKF